MNWEKENVPIILDELNTTKNGLSTTEAENRLKIYGKNALEEKEKDSQLKKFVSQFTEPLIILLIIAGTISALIQDYIDSAVIFFVVVLNAVLGFRQENQAENAMEKLKSMTSRSTIVLRDNKKTQVNVEDLTIGDVVILEEGDNIPADLRLIETYNLKIDESSLTGESLPVTKTSNVNHWQLQKLQKQIMTVNITT